MSMYLPNPDVRPTGVEPGHGKRESRCPRPAPVDCNYRIWTLVAADRRRVAPARENPPIPLAHSGRGPYSAKSGGRNDDVADSGNRRP